MVIACTTAGILDRTLDKVGSSIKFDYLVVDECAQGIEVPAWGGILRAKRIILAGDHK